MTPRKPLFAQRLGDEATLEEEEHFFVLEVEKPSKTRSVFETNRRKRALLKCGAIVFGVMLLLGLVSGLGVGLSSKDVEKYPCPRAFDVNEVDLVFFVVGDWGRRGSRSQQRAAHVMTAMARCMAPSFVISTGDNFYRSGLSSASDTSFKASFSDVYSDPSLKVPWYAVLGNHDYGDSLTSLMAADNGCGATTTQSLSQCSEGCCYSPLWQTSPYMDRREPRWHCRQSVWTLTHPLPGTGSLDVVLLDTPPLLDKYRSRPWARLPGGLNSVNKTQLKADTIAELNRSFTRASSGSGSKAASPGNASGSTWRVAVGHHPVYSLGEHCTGKETDCRDMAFLTTHLNGNGFAVYLSGHDHNLQLLSPPGERTKYVVSGAGSDVRTGKFAALSQAQRATADFLAEDQGFVAVTIAGDLMRLYYFTATAAATPFTRDITRPGSSSSGGDRR